MNHDNPDIRKAISLSGLSYLLYLGPKDSGETAVLGAARRLCLCQPCVEEAMRYLQFSGSSEEQENKVRDLD
jgi:hypothetical protein